MKDSEVNGEVKGIDISAKPEKKRKRKPPQHIDNRSFLALLILSFVSFTGIMIISMVGIFFIAFWANSSDKINVNVQTIANYKSDLENGRYSNIPLDKILGGSGWLDIVDASGNVLYSSGEKHSYTIGELDAISAYGSKETVRALRFQEGDGGYSYVITKSFEDGSPDQYQFLNSELMITSGTIPTTKTQYTEREFELLTYNTSNTDSRMEKLAFSGRDGACYAVYLDSNIADGVTPYVFLAIFGLGMISVIAVVLFFYIRYINRHVQKPLKALGAAMTSFAKGGYRENLIYRGTIEFEQLVSSFNDMVTLLNASEEQRKALEADKQRMLAGLSHDLKTPMTVILGFSKAIRDGLVSEEDKPKYLNLIVAKSEHMSELINEFYEYSKLEHPDFVLDLERLDVAEFVRMYLATRYDEFEIRGFELEADIVEERLEVEGDKAQLTRVLDNLVNNFFKYTPEGSTLFVSVRAEEDKAVISIGDNGGGIPEEARQDIFEPFVVAESSRNKQGSGLGLAVCKRIVEAHGGSICLGETKEDRSVEFVISLNRAQ